jgi:hypothetical protein
VDLLLHIVNEPLPEGVFDVGELEQLQRTPRREHNAIAFAGCPDRRDGVRNDQPHESF